MAGADIKRHGTPCLGAGMAAGKQLPRRCPGVHMDRNCISGVVDCLPGHRLALRHGQVPGHGFGQCRSHSGFRGRKGLFSLKLRLCRGSRSGPKDQLIRTVATDWQPQHQMNSRLRHPRMMPLVAPNRPMFSTSVSRKTLTPAQRPRPACRRRSALLHLPKEPSAAPPGERPDSAVPSADQTLP